MMRIHKLFSTQTLHTYSTLKRLVCALCIITGVLRSISNDSLRTSHNRITSREIIASKKKSHRLCLFNDIAVLLIVAFRWSIIEKLVKKLLDMIIGQEIITIMTVWRIYVLIYMYHGTVGKKNAKKEIPFREVFKTVSTFCGKINYQWLPT